MKPILRFWRQRRRISTATLSDLITHEAVHEGRVYDIPDVWIVAWRTGARLRGEPYRVTDAIAAWAILAARYEEGKAMRCRHCGRPIRAVHADSSVPYVHEVSGNCYCDVDVPEDAIMFAGTAGRTEAEPEES